MRTKLARCSACKNNAIFRRTARRFGFLPVWLFPATRFACAQHANDGAEWVAIDFSAPIRDTARRIEESSRRVGELAKKAAQDALKRAKPDHDPDH